jgi:uncharacterized membrane protein YfcA
MILTALLSVACGSLVGFTLGLIGGGGSILATPLLLYVVGMSNPHLAIGTGAVAVSANAFMNFTGHARAGTVHWTSAGIFASTGVVGALLGSSLGKTFDGQRLLSLFALLMIVVGFLMLRPRPHGSAVAPRLTQAIVARTAGTGFAVGMLSGFFGIGGGFLIVPGLMFATGMPMINAVGTSLFAVGMFGLATALNYAASGLVDWIVAAEYIAGGVFGGLLGMRAAIHLAGQKQTLTRIFAGVVFTVAIYMLWRSLPHA